VEAVTTITELARDLPARAVRARARVDASAIYRKHARRARRAGLDRLYLVLSFDCDTEHDAPLAAQIHARLAGMGVQPVYAVPGELLRKGDEHYVPLAESGSEFLNHGGAEHARYDEETGVGVSTLFYDDIGLDRVRQDVEYGHRIVSEVVGREPRGFRTPHFGSFQEPEQLAFLHDVLRELGYRFSTSTMPGYGVRYGPVFDRFGLPELPVTGVPGEPFHILDSWSFFAAPDRVHTPADYLERAQRLAELARDAGPGVINVYGDPLHVAEREEFFQAVEALTAVATPVSYGELLDRMAVR
jgi:hypothetical protein